MFTKTWEQTYIKNQYKLKKICNYLVKTNSFSEDKFESKA